jgi:putative transposase
MKNVAKVRIYPTIEQKQLLSQAFGCARWYWNNSLNATNEIYKQTGKGLSQIGMNNRLPALKKEFEWLGETYSQVLQSVSLNLSRAFVNFFEGRASTSSQFSILKMSKLLMANHSNSLGD